MKHKHMTEKNRLVFDKRAIRELAPGELEQGVGGYDDLLLPGSGTGGKQPTC
jgi:hypothetical protein